MQKSAWKTWVSEVGDDGDGDDDSDGDGDGDGDGDASGGDDGRVVIIDGF